MANWVIISDLATGIGTLVLAVATFSSVKAAKQSAKVSEQALLTANRPLLIASHIYDPAEKVRFVDNKFTKLPGGHAYISVTKDVIYFAISVRNIGQGPAVLDHWSFSTDEAGAREMGNLKNFRRLIRDVYVAPNDVGVWQSAIRGAKDTQFKSAVKAIREHRTLFLRVQYADQEGGQRIVSLFALVPHGKDEWLASAGRHWRIDGVDPREQP